VDFLDVVFGVFLVVVGDDWLCWVECFCEVV